MAVITETETVSQYLELLKGCLENRKELFQRSVYPGAAIVANECRKRVNALKVDNTLFAWSPWRKGITGGWKKALQDSMGIAKMKKCSDGWDVKLGFDGYSNIQENRGYKDGKKITVYNSNENPNHMIPNWVIARTTEKGSSNLPAQPFMSQTISASNVKASKAIEEEFLRIFQDYIKM